MNWKNPEELRTYRREEARRRRARDPEHMRAIARAYYVRHPRKKLSPEALHKICSDRIKRVLADPKHRAKIAARQRASALRRDLLILAQTVKIIRRRLEFPAKNRAKALAAYHANRDKINNARRERYALDHPPAKPLERAFRRALSKQASRLAVLGRTAKKMLGPHNPQEKKLVRAVRRRFQKALKCRTESCFVLQMCGCSLPKLRQHLEGLFKPGMSWNNYGFRGWHIDHIKPVAAFYMADLGQRKQCFHWTNLQPLWAAENIKKRDSMPESRA